MLVREELLQWLMDRGQLEVSEKDREEPQICKQSAEMKAPPTPKVLVICFTRNMTGPRSSHGNIPPPAFGEGVATEIDSLSAKVINITGLSGVTRSGWVFVTPHSAELPSKGKAPMTQESAGVATPSKEVDPPVVKGAEKKEGLQRKAVTLEEAYEHGYEPGMGLGKDSHENANVVDIRGNPYKYGLGFVPRKPGRRNAPSRLRADRAWPGHANQCFTSVGIMFEEEVVAIGEEAPQDPQSFVRPCHPNFQVGNWHVMSQSEVYTADSICEDRSFEDPNTEGLIIDFDREVSQTINEEEEEDVLSPELERLVTQEEREMKPHQEETELKCRCAQTIGI
ncbi:hypothetical protein HKD37_06G017131 [Glycine soja]